MHTPGFTRSRKCPGFWSRSPRVHSRRSGLQPAGLSSRVAHLCLHRERTRNPRQYYTAFDLGQIRASIKIGIPRAGAQLNRASKWSARLFANRFTSRCSISLLRLKAVHFACFAIQPEQIKSEDRQQRDRDDDPIPEDRLPNPIAEVLEVEIRQSCSDSVQHRSFPPRE